MGIRLENLVVKFGDFKAINDVTLQIPKGKLVSLLGPSGSGKSTTLFTISGIHKPSSGKIFFGDRDVTGLEPEQLGIGLVFQNYALYPHMTVRENILFPLKNLKWDKQEAEKRVVEVAKIVKIADQLDKKPSQLSGGQQQRVAIARALAKKPEILLLDEPLSNLDTKLRVETRQEIRRIQKETGVTAIFVTHDQEEAMSISDEIVVMKSGLEQQKGRPQSVYENPINQFVAKFLGTPPINIFSGKILDGGLYIGDERIGDSKLENQDVTIGIRPEGFEINPEGELTINVKQIEHIGRDKSLIATNPHTEKETFRFIIDSDIPVHEQTIVKVSVKPNKCYVFDKLTEKRLQ